MTTDGTPSRKLRDRRVERRQRRDGEYDAFISYSRADLDFAADLQRGLERIAKPWHRARSMRIFRDMSSLSPDSGLWASIETGLEQSSWLILLMSLESAGSRWVAREVEWWLEHRSIDRLLLVNTDGVISWDETARDFDEATSTAVSAVLRGGRFPAEPSWVDATWSRSGPDPDRLQEVAASLASRIKEIPKDELFAAAVREHRRTMRLARTGVTSLATLLAVAGFAAVVALGQRDKARTQATLATSRQLAAMSGQQAGSNLRVSLDLAAEAAKRDVNPQTRSALLGAALASPHLQRFVDVGAAVTQLQGSADGKVVVAGLGDGRVMVWEARDPHPHAVMRLSRQVESLSVSANGDHVVASAGDAYGLERGNAKLWRLGEQAVALRVPAGQTPGTVAISPSGSTVLVTGVAQASGGEATMSRVDGANGRGVEVLPLPPEQTVGKILLVSDRRAALYDTAYGSYEGRDLDSWTVPTTSGSVSLGAHESFGAPAANGGFITGTNGAQEIPVWRTTGGPRPQEAPLSAEAPITTNGPLALSADGGRLAVSNNGVIYVAPVLADGKNHPLPVTLTGNGNVDLLTFLGATGTRLVSANGSQVAQWDTTQVDRLSRSMKVPITSACSACSGAHVTLSPDSRRAAVITDGGATAALVDLRHRTSETMPDGELDYSYSRAVFGDVVALPINPPAGGTSVSPPADGLPDGVRSWRMGEDGEARVVAAAVSRDGRHSVAVDDRGTIFVQLLQDGSVVDRADGPSELALGSDSLTAAAVAEGRDVVATALGDVVTVRNARTGKALHRIKHADITQLAFGGTRLFVQDGSGELAVYADLGARRERVIAGDRGFTWPPVPDPQGRLVARLRGSSEIVLVDANTGQRLVTIPANPGAEGVKVGMAFSPDGTHLITVTDEQEYQAGATLVDRNLSSATLVRSICRGAGTPLTLAEWRAITGLAAPKMPVCH